MRTHTAHKQKPITSPVKYRRGDPSPCGKYKFWGYLSHVRKSDGKRTERWIPIHQFESYRKSMKERSELTDAQKDFYQQQRTKPKIDPKEYVWKTYGIK